MQIRIVYTTDARALQKEKKEEPINQKKAKRENYKFIIF
jgi:hypothetical protein